ncbi:MAG: bifunctional riboflavin kinase/FAD synthetase [Ruminococcaceae bacterium]|nr:bifunctional riboflavin kinase/FAD synthetase [Oscillospiraceae bacterium]
MQLLSKRDLPLRHATALAIGNFDGLHIGHMKLMDEILFLSRRHELKSVVWTFNEHPENIISGKYVTKSITTIDEKVELLSEKKVDLMYIEDFRLVRDCTPEEFVDRILIEQFNVKFVVCGFNFRFGKGNSADAEYLKERLALHGVQTCIISPIIYDDKIVSSTYIRSLIEKGDMEMVARLMRREFYINFPVVQGRHLGREIGVPTINQEFPPDHIIPMKGVYACAVYINGEPYIAVANVGTKPTVEGDHISCETHILDFCGDLYGKNIKVCFFKRLRDEKKFSSLEELKGVIRNDIDRTREYFNLKF